MEEGAAAYPRRLFLLWVMGGYYYLLIYYRTVRKRMAGSVGRNIIQPAGGLWMADDIQHIQLTHMND